ncbi:hypothetical protein [Mycobacterium sp.]|uniref:hypothetical protein n=1 Tax=Mycobacterium sp. TaxID=1785 RepID=UPI002C64228E|nr:hypothetical protein [Mycobacterium sp.]HME49036.1 hypothetical protein [Mycobacterium sp.]
MRENRKRADALAHRNAEIAARADQQHNWVMQGDDRGVYGPEGARLMHHIRSGGGQTTAPPATRWRLGPFGTRFAG